MIDLVYYVTSLLFFDIPILYYCIVLRSLIIICLSFGYINLSLGIYLSSLLITFSFVTVSALLRGKVLETLVISTANILPVKSRVFSTVF